jgi:hypothetical protein
VLAGWRARAMVESPSHLRDHLEPLTLTLLAALLHTRLREITDTLVELLISTMHPIGARADRKVTEELVNAFKRVTGKENPLFAIAEASLDRPDDLVKEVVYPAVNGGEQTLRELIHEFKTKGQVYGACQAAQTTRPDRVHRPAPRRDAQRPVRAGHRPAEVGLAGDRRPGQERCDQADRLGRRTGATQPAPAQERGPQPLGHGPADRHA